MSDFWSYVFDSEYRQRADIEDLKRRGQAVQRRVRRGLRDLEERVEELELQVGSLALLCRALLSLLREQGTVDPEALAAAVDAIDLEDGVRDGLVTPERLRPREKPKAPAPRRRRRR
ncbi:MAG: hypothetical protein D6731_04210 [Planctomycetota bacterium]|nr:MAG: hypothetical protein D6731_04210 [Planctomycetota bacterium]